MTLKYESEILYGLMKRDGDDSPSDVLPYESELKEKYLNQVTGAYPKLQDYRPEWLNYNLYKHLPADFPVESVSNVTEASFQNVVPYAFGKAILKGQTLVNLVKNIDIKFRQSSSDSWGTIFAQSNRSTITKVTSIKPSTKYLIRILSKSEQVYVRFFNDSDNKSNGDSGWLNSNSTFTTLSDTSKINMSFRLSSNNEEYTDVSEICNIMLIEYQDGMENWDIPYFEGMQSVKMPVLKTVGKNLFDVTKHIELKVNNDGSYSTIGTSASKYDVLYQLEPNTDYILSFDKFGDSMCWVGCRINGIFYNNSGGDLRKKITTDSSGLVTISFGANSANDVGHTITNTQLEKSSMYTSYEPYKTNILTVNDDVTLRGIGNVQDTLDLTTGELVQNFGSLYFDGSENWNIFNRVGTMVTAKLNLPNLEHNFSVATSLSDNIPVVPQAWTGTKGISLLNQAVYLTVEQSIANTNDDFKNWISSIGGINLIYRLSQSTVKTVDLTCKNVQGQIVDFMPLEGTMNVQTSSDTITPLLDMDVPVEAITQNLNSFAGTEE